VRHPELLLIPLLMLSDFVLTVAGARLRRAGHERHFKLQHYELNPLWQRAITTMRWFNPRHLALTLLITVALLVLWEWLDPDDPMLPFFFGVILGVQGTMNGRHLGNLALFAYIKRHPAEIDGMVAMSHALALWLSAFQLCAVALPLALLAAYSPQPAVLGAFVGVIALMLVHLIWIAHQLRKRRRGDASATIAPSDAQPVSSDSLTTSRASSTASATNLP